MKLFLQIFFAFVLFSMIGVTSWASFIENVFVGGAKIVAEPWGVATLFDTYFAFLTFYVWVYYKETSVFARWAWLVAILLFGNIAMALYMLIQLRRWPSGSGIEDLLLRKKH